IRAIARPGARGAADRSVNLCVAKASSMAPGCIDDRRSRRRSAAVEHARRRTVARSLGATASWASDALKTRVISKRNTLRRQPRGGKGLVCTLLPFAVMVVGWRTDL